MFGFLFKKKKKATTKPVKRKNTTKKTATKPRTTKTATTGKIKLSRDRKEVAMDFIHHLFMAKPDPEIYVRGNGLIILVNGDSIRPKTPSEWKKYVKSAPLSKLLSGVSTFISTGAEPQKLARWIDKERYREVFAIKSRIKRRGY